MARESAASPIEIKKIAERALLLQSYLLRRAWGVPYAAWSLALFVTVFVSPSEPDVALRLIVDIAVSGTALVAVLWEFRRARDTADVRNAIINVRRSKPLGYRVLLPTWVTIYAIAILTVIFFRPQAVLVLVAVYGTLAAYFYYSLRMSFPLRLPPEGKIALSSLAVAAIVSVGLLPLLGHPAPYGILWGMIVALWGFASAYARTRRPPAPTEVIPT